MTRRLRVALVGTQGVPNAYGGFETLAEYLVHELAGRYDLTVYCSSVDQKTQPRTYQGARLSYWPIGSHGGAGMVYDSLTLAHARLTHDVVLFLGFGAGMAAPFIPGLKRRMVLNFGGLDWKRDKWSPRAKAVIRLCERWLVTRSARVVADNDLIADYVRDEYGLVTEAIAYGGDQAVHRPVDPTLVPDYPFLTGPYALAVARIQADNNIDMLLSGYPETPAHPLVFIGNWSASDYGLALRQRWAGAPHLRLLDAIYDRRVLDVIRSNCSLYIHGHSAGGTNPSLCEAMYLGLPVVAYASGYNERTMANLGWFFHDAQQLRQIVQGFDTQQGQQVGRQLQQVARERYTWAAVAQAYARVFDSLA